MPDQIYSVKWNDVSKKNYTYDGLGRVTRQVVYPSVGVSLENTYTYKDVGENNTSTQVSHFQRCPRKQITTPSGVVAFYI